MKSEFSSYFWNMIKGYKMGICNCSECNGTQSAGHKVGKEHYCFKSHRELKTQQAKEKSKSVSQINKLATGYSSKPAMLRLADSLFSKWAIKRDSDINGNVSCPGCGFKYNVEDIDGDGKKIIQLLHFQDRDIYSIRWAEDNGHAGCCYCNLDMHLHRNGKAAKNYLRFMWNKYGEKRVSELMAESRKINKLDIALLKSVIEKYGHNR